MDHFPPTRAPLLALAVAGAICGVPAAAAAPPVPPIARSVDSSEMAPTSGERPTADAVGVPAVGDRPAQRAVGAWRGAQSGLAPPAPRLGATRPDASSVDPAALARRWVWPLRPTPPVVRRFDPPEVVWGSGHRGVDLGAASGSAVLAPAAGVVTFAGPVAGRPVLVVAHEGGLRSTFEPVAAQVAVGTAVEAGAVVGRLTGDAGHCAPAVCVHWGVLRGRTYLDPLALLAGRVVLLPLR